MPERWNKTLGDGKPERWNEGKWSSRLAEVSLDRVQGRERSGKEEGYVRLSPKAQRWNTGKRSARLADEW